MSRITQQVLDRVISDNGIDNDVITIEPISDETSDCTDGDNEVLLKDLEKIMLW